MPGAQQVALELLQTEPDRRAAVRHEAKPGWAQLQVAERLTARRKAALDKRLEAYGAATEVYGDAKASLHEAEQKGGRSDIARRGDGCRGSPPPGAGLDYPSAASVVSLTKCMQALKDLLPSAAQTAFEALCLALAAHSPDDVEMAVSEPPQEELPPEAPPVLAPTPPKENPPPEAPPLQNSSAPVSMALARREADFARNSMSPPPNATEAANEAQGVLEDLSLA